MTSVRKIGALNALFMMLLSVGLYNHVLLIPILLIKGGRDSWVGVLIAALIMCVWLWMFSRISKQTSGASIPSWIAERFGVISKYVIVIPIATSIFVMNWVTFKGTISWSIATYLPYTPRAALAILLALMCWWVSYLGIRNIALTAGILGPLVVMCGFFIMSANMPKKDYSMLFPVLVNGMTPVWQCVSYALGGLMELFLILMFQQHLMQKKIGFLQLTVLNLFLVGITVGPLIGAISAFGPSEALNQRYPAFEQWRIVQIGKYIEHLDFLSIFQWLSGAFVRISLLGFLTMDMFAIKNPKHRGLFLAGLFLLLIFLTLLPISDKTFFHFVMTYYNFLVLAVFCSATVLLFIVTIPHRKLEGQS
jgi:spore germination protein KB